ncbi:transmembrane-type terpene cyclase [Streptomyces alanosinicus]|uniref:Uncharacterized protein n=1 Tax=Streptomyces alanosinicus TaxID=68171 RepID=A0A918YKQ9_9ACTN|nr:hypothetical protein [Streptomyces alanosinicus]GHE06562.1 hypothetical protein GCM10010339_47590 [Streptomyces alanosinicus]
MSDNLMLQSLGFDIGVALSGLFWTIAYVLIIRQGFRDKTYGMPVVALCGNISWEFTVAFIAPLPGILQTISYVWFFIDTVIVYQVLRYGPSQFPGISPRLFYGMFGLTLVAAFFGILLLNQMFHRYYHDNWAIYTGFADALMMAGLFLSMLHNRSSTSGQSVPIAVCMFLGNATSIAWLVTPPPQLEGSALQVYLIGATTTLNLIYGIALWRVRGRINAVDFAAV